MNDLLPVAVWTTTAVALLCAAPSTGAAQGAVTVAPLPARPADVATIDGIIQAFYDVISGPAGQPREWARDRTLYIPGVKFVAMSTNQNAPVAHVMSHQEFVESSDPWMVGQGFFEKEIHRVTHRFGNIAHVFSTYAFRRTADGPVQGRGVNSIELFWDGTRWWIAGAIWDGERPDNPIPAAFLPDAPRD
jgi:hypothetical protein